MCLSGIMQRRNGAEKVGEIMVTEKNHVDQITKPGPFGGNGEITVRNILDGPKAMYEKGRVFCHTTVYSGSSIGFHVHDNESETYYILSGHGIFNDDGQVVEVGPGDVLFTGDNQGHGIEAACGENIEMIALILYHNPDHDQTS